MELQSLRTNINRLQENTTCNLPVKTNGRTPHPFNTNTLFLRTIFSVPGKSPRPFKFLQIQPAQFSKRTAVNVDSGHFFLVIERILSESLPAKNTLCQLFAVISLLFSEGKKKPSNDSM